MTPVNRLFATAEDPYVTGISATSDREKMYAEVSNSG